LNDPILEFHVTVRFGKEKFHYSVQMTRDFTIEEKDFTLTFLDNTIDSISSKYYTLEDTANPALFYFIPKTDCNSDSTFDPSRLGWFKTGQPPTKQLNNYLTVYTMDCSEDLFRFGNSAKMFTSYIQEHPNLIAQNLFPGSMLIDSTTAQVFPTDSDTRSMPQLGFGGMYIYDTAGNPFPVGVTPDGFPTFSEYEPVFMPAIDTNIGTVYNLTFNCDMWRDTRIEPHTVFMARTCIDPFYQGVWGICNGYKYANQTNFTINCVNSAITGVDWPEQQEGTFTFVNGAGGFTFIPVSDIVPYNTTWDALVIPGNDISINFKLNLKEVTIKFNSNIIIPVIDEVEDKGEYLAVTAHADEGQGKCIFLSSNSIFTSLSVQLSETSKVYKLPVAKSEFSGETIVTLQCFEKYTSVRFKMEIKKKQVDVNEESIVEPEVREVSIKKTLGEKIGLFFKAPFMAMKGIRLPIQDYLGWAITIYVFLVLCTIFIMGLLFWKLRFYIPIINRFFIKSDTGFRRVKLF